MNNKSPGRAATMSNKPKIMDIARAISLVTPTIPNSHIAPASLSPQPAKDIGINAIKKTNGTIKSKVRGSISKPRDRPIREIIITARIPRYIIDIRNFIVKRIQTKINYISCIPSIENIHPLLRQKSDTKTKPRTSQVRKLTNLLLIK